MLVWLVLMIGLFVIEFEFELFVCGHFSQPILVSVWTIWFLNTKKFLSTSKIQLQVPDWSTFCHQLTQIKYTKYKSCTSIQVTNIYHNYQIIQTQINIETDKLKGEFSFTAQTFQVTNTNTLYVQYYCVNEKYYLYCSTIKNGYFVPYCMEH